jgi:N6-L-threonylcarbamoyladenine synthase
MNHKDRIEDQIPDIAAGFQEAVMDVLCYKAIRAAMVKGCDRIALVGGVAANSRLREKLRSDARRQEIRVHIPSLHLCGDNAAMIALVGYHYLKAGIVSDLQDDVFSKN